MTIFSLEELCEFSLDTAKHTLIGQPGAQLMPQFHIQFIDRQPAIMVTPWRDDDEKRLTVRAIRAALKQFRPTIDSYAFMSEAWIAIQNHRPKATDLMPSQREDRREAVIITCFNKDKGFMRTYEIKRGPDAAITELTLENPIGDADSFEGRLYNLFEDE